MKQAKIHQYIFGLAILASIISFSGYAKNIECPYTTTEWVIVEHSEFSKAEFYVCFKKIVNQEINLNFYYNFNFKCFLYQHKNIFAINYKSLKYKRLEFKNSFLLLESRIITPSNSNKAHHIFLG